MVTLEVRQSTECLLITFPFAYFRELSGSFQGTQKGLL